MNLAAIRRGLRGIRILLVAVIIAAVALKGGVGKSTLARALAREFAAAGMTAKIADLDVLQGTSVSWNMRREARGILPRVSVESFRSAAEALKAADGFYALVLDSPARTNAGTLEIARQAHLVVTPCGASTDDLEPAVLTFLELVREGIPKAKLVVALSRIMTEAEERDARAYISQAGFSCLQGSLPERTAYRAAQGEGRAVTEVKFPSLRKRADELIQSIVDRVSDG